MACDNCKDLTGFYCPVCAPTTPAKPAVCEVIPVLRDGWYAMPNAENWLHLQDAPEWRRQVVRNDDPTSLVAWGGKPFHAYGDDGHCGAFSTLQEAMAAADGRAS